jgi:hypothetical protein
MATSTLGMLLVGTLCLSPLSASGELSSIQKERLEGLPKYDPIAHTLPPAPRTMGTSMHRGVSRARAQSPKASSAAVTPNPPSEDKPTILQRFMVTERRVNAEPAPSFPLMIVRPPVGKDDKTDHTFETPAARDERLVKKHLSDLDRLFLNRYTFFGVSKEKRARESEAVEQASQQLDEVAEALEAKSSGQTETDEERKLKEAYFDAFVSRPK